MDAGLLKAGIVMAIGLTLLVPTFNALNASYVKNVPPPPWLPTPPTPPDITPPTDMTPPTDFTPPTNYKGPIPPVNCPPPVLRGYNPQFNDTMDARQGGSYSNTYRFSLPNSTVAFQANVSFRQWQASSISVSMSAGGTRIWDNSTNGNAGLLATGRTDTDWVYNSTRESSQLPKAGNYTMTFSSQFPIAGDVHAEVIYVLPCGGLGAR